MIPAKEARRILREKGAIRVVAIRVPIGRRTVELRVSKADALRLLADVPAEELIDARRVDVVHRDTGETLHAGGWFEIGAAP